MPKSIVVVDHDPAWARQFAQLRAALEATLGALALAIEHVGSTSVPGLAAKPILDIDVVIEAPARLPEVITRLAALGYAHEGERGVTGRHAFRPVSKDSIPASWPRHHLYVCPAGGLELRRHLAFRDWLRAHPEGRRRYAARKRELAARHTHDIVAYSDGKRGVIEAALVEATGVGLCTARAVLRPFSPDDAPYAHPVFADPEVMRYAAGPPDADLATTAARLDRYIALQRARGFSKWVAWDRESGEYLGDAGLTVLAETGELELGYRLARRHWGRGLATELARAWLTRALDELQLGRVIAFADPANAASVRVMEKLGMRLDRRDRLAGIDCVVYEARRES
ncbi:MAG: GNAT family N-acetyltransferase [Myxococcales bacterium]|nr:GNAT family N-acetyltransferase [Myxococcales bacterium]MCB9751515.1 GNAT family N-acetyltransferase [Myxococcales bacterium]